MNRRTILSAVLASPLAVGAEATPRVQKAKYRCGDIILDREGLFSGSFHAVYLLHGRDSRDDGKTFFWGALCYRPHAIAKDGSVDGGAYRVELYDEDLDKGEVIGHLQMPAAAIYQRTTA